jgi:hypothetical protein
VRRFVPLVALALAGAAAAPTAAPAPNVLRVRIRDHSAGTVLRRGGLRVRVDGTPNTQVHLTGVALVGDPPRPRKLVKARAVSLGADGSATARLRLRVVGRRRLRTALVRCRNRRVRVRARASGGSASARRSLRGGHGCGARPPRLAPPRGARPAQFKVGAATIGFTPPLHGKVANDASDCAAPPSYDGPRKWAFMEPYEDADHVDPPDPLDPGPPENVPKNGHYDYGEQYMDCNGNDRWDGNFLGGGSNAPRYYDKEADAPSARALVVDNGRRALAVEVTDQEGLFNVYQERIRAKVIEDLGGPKSPLRHRDMFLSATHDESAPQTLGLDGPRDTISATNDYFLDYFVERSAKAIEQAYANRRKATIRYAHAHEPANFRQCWSSYPYVDDPAVPVLQAVGTNGRAIATLADVSQHAETLGFNSNPTEKLWLSADWPHFFRAELERRYGGVAIEMAGSVGSVEQPEVFPNAISAVPQRYVDEDHPAGCRTLFDAAGMHVPLGYLGETKAYGVQLARAVASTIAHHSSPSVSRTISGARADICVPLSNKLFAAAAAVGVFAHRPGYADDCKTKVEPAPNGTTTGQEAKSQVAAFRIGDGSFISVPGEVFPFTFLRSFLGPNDMPYPKEPLPAWLLPHMHTRYRFVDGLAEDMIGYIFPSGNGVGVPGERDPSDIDPSSDDRFGCHHSDDGEAASSQTGNIVALALAGLLGTGHEKIVFGRFVMPDGRLSRDPQGHPTIKCQVDKTYRRAGPAAGIERQNGIVVHPPRWMDAHGRPQARPDRTTRGYFTRAGKRVWLDVFPELNMK